MTAPTDRTAGASPRRPAVLRQPAPAGAETGAASPAAPVSPTPAPRIIGLDLSLSATGVAGHGWTDSLRPPKGLLGTARLHWIRARVFEHTTRADLVAIEGPAYSRALGAGHHEAAGLWWLVTWTLHRQNVPVAVVPPTVLKKYATGKGNATKPDMRMALFQRTGLDERDDNQVDAWWLYAVGADHLGLPAAVMPAAHRKALDSVAWPEGVSA